MNKALCCNVVLLILCSTPSKAQQKEDEIPSIALLEYLAEMTEVDGKFYGPQDMSLALCQSVSAEQNKQSTETSTETSAETSNENSNETNIGVNGGQDDKAQKNEKSANKPGCKYHD